MKLKKLITLLALLAASVTASEAGVTVIANQSISQSSISAEDLQKIFLGKKRSLESGTRVKPVTLKSGTAHEEFVTNIVNKSTSQFSSYWKRKIVDGTGIPPKSFASDEELVAFVAANRDTIGYVSDNTTPSGVTILSIE